MRANMGSTTNSSAAEMKIVSVNRNRTGALPGVGVDAHSSGIGMCAPVLDEA